MCGGSLAHARAREGTARCRSISAVVGVASTLGTSAIAALGGGADDDSVSDSLDAVVSVSLEVSSVTPSAAPSVGLAATARGAAAKAALACVSASSRAGSAAASVAPLPRPARDAALSASSDAASSGVSSALVYSFSSAPAAPPWPMSAYLNGSLPISSARTTCGRASGPQQ